MSFQPRSSSFQRLRPRPPAANESRGSFAVGSQVLITASVPGQRELELIDIDGMPTGVRMPIDERTVITAWRPRRAAPARYRVRSAAGVEGWIDAPNLRRPPAPPPPRPVAPPVVPPKAKAKPVPSPPKARATPKPAAPPAPPKAKPKASPPVRARAKAPKKTRARPKRRR